MIGLWSSFVTVFLAELGDNTQIATLLFAADPRLSRLGVFVASTGALALSSLLAVLVGGQLSTVLSPRLLKGIAGVGFLLIGLWTLLDLRAG
jgi:putative Ca2+/H+ antiporter (TMEM165/GDT1 family)